MTEQGKGSSYAIAFLLYFLAIIPSWYIVPILVSPLNPLIASKNLFVWLPAILAYAGIVVGLMVGICLSYIGLFIGLQKLVGHLLPRLKRLWRGILRELWLTWYLVSHPDIWDKCIMGTLAFYFLAVVVLCAVPNLSETIGQAIYQGLSPFPFVGPLGFAVFLLYLLIPITGPIIAILLNIEFIGWFLESILKENRAKEFPMGRFILFNIPMFAIWLGISVGWTML